MLHLRTAILLCVSLAFGPLPGCGGSNASVDAGSEDVSTGETSVQDVGADDATVDDLGAADASLDDAATGDASSMDDAATSEDAGGTDDAGGMDDAGTTSDAGGTDDAGIDVVLSARSGGDQNHFFHGVRDHRHRQIPCKHRNGHGSELQR